MLCYLCDLLWLSFVVWGVVAFLSVVLYALLIKFTARTFPVPPTGSAILISGADTGFGRLTSIAMAQSGYKVYAGVLSESSGSSLKEEFTQIMSQNKVVSGGEIVPLVFDITNDAQLDEAFARLNKDLSETGLQLLFNNAGIGKVAPLELQPFAHIRQTIEINLLGHINVTKRALPLMRKAKAPRIVNITSLAGKLGASQFTAYSSSKFGLEGVCDCLRRELRHLNFSVSSIIPGFAKTAIVTGFKTYAEEINRTNPDSLKKVYEDVMDDDAGTVHSKVAATSMPPEVVVKAVTHALLDPKPLSRYYVGTQAKVACFMLWLFPDYALDYILNFVVNLQKKGKKKSS
jgi:NAD(P)-dependent dehydrogenase (short-subunit alcohol dehydrogenase family)